MERRAFIVGGATLGLASQQKATGEPRFDPVAVEAALGRIDSRMRALSAVDFAPRAPTGPREAELSASRTRLGRAASRTIYFLGAFLEMEEHERLHPGVQLRLRRLAPEVEAAVDGTTAFLESLGPAERKAVREAFRQDPDLGAKVGEELQRVAREDGFGFTRRLDLRLAVDDLAKQLRAQNPELLIDPLVQKVRKTQANPRSDAEQERVQAIRTGEKAFWDFQQRSTNAVAQWDRIYAARPASYLGQIDETYPAAAQKEHDESKRNTINTGLIVMGVGAGITGIGWILYAAGVTSTSGPGIIMGVTIGPVLLLVGLIILIVGALK